MDLMEGIVTGTLSTALDGLAQVTYLIPWEPMTLPAAVWQRVSEPSIHLLDRVATAWASRIQVNLYARKGDDLAAMTAAIRAGCHAMQPTSSGGAVVEAMIVDNVLDVTWDEMTPRGLGRIIDILVYWRYA